MRLAGQLLQCWVWACLMKSNQRSDFGNNSHVYSVPSGCFQTVVQPSKGSTVTVSTTLPLAQCAVCTVSGDNLTSCHSILSLVPEAEVKLLFNCSQPLDQSFTVTVNHSIGEFAIKAILLLACRKLSSTLSQCGCCIVLFAFFRIKIILLTCFHTVSPSIASSQTN